MAAHFGQNEAMAQTFETLDDTLVAWIDKQPVFFVATAPSDRDGHVNVSPKGYDSFRVLGPTRVAYLDLTGSGVETIAHIRDNGRLTVMFCAFSGPPRILRLYGSAEVVLPEDEGFAALAGGFPPLPGVRSIIVLSLERITTSCGFAVPEMELRERAPHLDGGLPARHVRRDPAGLSGEGERLQHRRPARAVRLSPCHPCPPG